MVCCTCSCERLVSFSTVLLVAGALFIGGVKFWLKEKSYVFSADKVAMLTNEVLKINIGKGHNETFAAVEQLLRERYPDYILPSSQTEWIFVNAGGWMGSMYLLHASLTEYVLFFGTAIDTSGHSGRYWAEISDTVIGGKFVQWKEGTTEVNVYFTGDTVLHGIGETTAVQWTAPFWAVEYGRGFIPSTLGFALSDSVFSTQDFVIIYKTFRVYTVAIIRGWFISLQKMFVF